jgi:hypothetical protein
MVQLKGLRAGAPETPHNTGPIPKARSSAVALD